MDREDRRRYFVVGSVIIEVVTPILQQRIKDDQTFRAFGTLQDYLNNPQIKHILFHLRHNNVWCCNDTNNCVHSGSLPLNYRQWGILYSKTTGPCRHNCHCKYTANAVQLDDPDISLCCIILLNCCNLTSNEYNTIQNLRQMKNNFLSHNTEGAITADEYKSVWPDLTAYVLQLDNTKEDILIRIENRPLDGALCHKYNAILLDIHQKLDEIGASIQRVDETIQRIDRTTNEIGGTVQRIDQTVTGTNTAVMGIQATMEKERYDSGADIDNLEGGGGFDHKDANMIFKPFFEGGGNGFSFVGTSGGHSHGCGCFNHKDANMIFKQFFKGGGNGFSFVGTRGVHSHGCGCFNHKDANMIFKQCFEGGGNGFSFGNSGGHSHVGGGFSGGCSFQFG
ncbi:unnamed protein product [Mytilus edulis]|uniref:DZIP3-like HEPN domain-containing protein n=1 Tax=Mytilus edulis TaxID=6550 RepID=A0A8S3SVF7_MYTED|nr:unnamed protein product [Mytilus edulis]